MGFHYLKITTGTGDNSPRNKRVEVNFVRLLLDMYCLFDGLFINQ